MEADGDGARCRSAVRGVRRRAATADGRGDGELHLVAVAVDLGRGHDGPERDRVEAAEALEAVGHLLGLEVELAAYAICWSRQPPQRPKYGHGASTRCGDGVSTASITPRPNRARASVRRTRTRSPGTPPGTNTT